MMYWIKLIHLEFSLLLVIAMVCLFIKIIIQQLGRSICKSMQRGFIRVLDCPGKFQGAMPYNYLESTVSSEFEVFMMSWSFLLFFPSVICVI